MTTYSAFRVYVTASQAGGNIAIGEFAVYATLGGPNILTGGTPIASIAQPGYPATAAFDGDPTTAWASNNTIPAWLGYQLPSSVAAPAGYSLTAWSNTSYGVLAPKDFSFDGYDGASWVTLSSEASVAWTAPSQQRQFPVTPGLGATKALSYAPLGAGVPGQLSSPKAITYVVLAPNVPITQRIKVRLVSVPLATT